MSDDAPREGAQSAPALKRRRIVVGVLLAASAIGGMFLLAGSLEGFPRTIHRLESGDPLWLALGAGLEILSIAGYAALFWSVVARDAPRIGLRASLEIPLAGIAALRLLATGGAGGFAVSAWALRRAGMAAREVGSRLVAGVVVQYAFYMLALIVAGVGLWTGLLAGGGSFALTLMPALFAFAVMIAVLAIALLPERISRLDAWRHTKRRPAAATGDPDTGRLAAGRRWEGRSRAAPAPAPGSAAPAGQQATSERGQDDPHAWPPRSRRSRARIGHWARAGVVTTHEGVRSAIEIVASPRADLRTAGLLGAIAYWGFDVAVLWTSFRAFGDAPAIAVVVMGYFLGTLGGLLPGPGGVGGVEGAMVAAFIAFGVEPARALIAVLAYRVISFWLPTLPGIMGYFGLRRTVRGWEAAAPKSAVARRGGPGGPGGRTSHAHG
jgi:uncharacterized membrane protein YbhN (UPF0104 family)